MSQLHDFGDGLGPVPAHRHLNPDNTIGGWVAETASVADSVRIGFYATVFNSACVVGNANIKDGAKVYEKALLNGRVMVANRAQVKGNAKVFYQSLIKDNAIVDGDAEIHGATIDGNLKVRTGYHISRNSVVEANHKLAQVDIDHIMSLDAQIG